ncbi:MAG: peptidyl-prolyl cis-trans isomerase [Syntrophomonadaceae bacterium]|jgi:parvulin-like peptidyl-prolyl isomerase
MKKIIAILILLLAALPISGCNSKDNSKAVGEVNGIEISNDEYEKHLELLKTSYKIQMAGSVDASKDEVIPEETLEKLEDQAFDDLVYQKLFIQEAEKKNIDVTKEELEKAVDDFKQALGEEGYKSFLKDLGLSQAEFEHEMKMDQLITKLRENVTSDIKVSDDEAKAYYDENKDMYTVPAGIRISHILVSSEDKAKDLITKINNGEDFAELAKIHSTCASAANGGDLGIANEQTNFVEEFKEAALKLEPGEMTQTPVKTQFGFHIIKAGARQQESVIAFEEAKNEILASLQQDKELSAFQDYAVALYNNADIKDYRN